MIIAEVHFMITVHLGPLGVKFMWRRFQMSVGHLGNARFAWKVCGR